MQPVKYSVGVFRLTLRNEFVVLISEGGHYADVMNDNIITVITESSVAAGGGEPSKETGKL